jgi:hypothetical protein
MSLIQWSQARPHLAACSTYVARVRAGFIPATRGHVFDAIQHLVTTIRKSAGERGREMGTGPDGGKDARMRVD